MRIVFRIPDRGLEDLFPHTAHDRRPQHLVYVELFTDLDTKGVDHGLYKISPASNARGDRLAMIVPVGDIERSCHLIPHFGPVAPREWTCYNVLDIVLCRAGPGSNTRAWARLWGARAHCSFEPGPGSRLRSGPARLGLKPGPLVCLMEVRNIALTDTAKSLWTV